MGCIIRLMTATTLVLGVQLTGLEAAQARFEPQPKANDLSQPERGTSSHDTVFRSWQQAEEPPNTNGTGGGR